MNEDEVATWLVERAMARIKHPTDMGTLENLVDELSLECRRRALQRLVQHCADAQAMNCPICNRSLLVEARHRLREVNSCSGPIQFKRGYGFCEHCGTYFHPADRTLGLQERAPASPRVQEICALSALRAPAGQAQDDVRRLTGINLDPSTLHREARRQGKRALALRDRDEQRTQTPEGLAQLAAQATALPDDFTLIIQIDAWNIRERDHWGQTEAFRAIGKDTGRWHWVYTATLFRLDQRATTASGRPVISQRGFVATRKGVESFQRQLYAEAVGRGVLSTQKVLILADGAIWIWNIAKDRFKDALQRVDLYHVQEHLWGLANQLFGQGSHEARQWVLPYLQKLKNHSNGALEVLQGLEQIKVVIKKLTADQQKAVDREINYFQQHQNRMDYKNGKNLGQPVGSGAVESTCSQYQRRFKLTGQFWSLAGDEDFLALFTLHHNGRWSQLFPHDAKQISMPSLHLN